MADKVVQVPNVRAEKGVTGDVCDSEVAGSLTEGLFEEGIEVVLAAFVDEDVDDGSGPAYSLRV